MWAANKLPITRCLFNRVSNLVLKQSRANFIKGYWPEPITQQTLDQFLSDIDYFERPEKFIDIGLKLERSQRNQAPQLGAHVNNDSSSTNKSELENLDVEQLLSDLGAKHELPPLDLDDVALSQDQIKNVAVTHGIYRDLFHEYRPKRGQIKFTPDQAKKLSKLVPHYWISDQPFANVDRHLKKAEPLRFFEPIIRISARFVHDMQDEDAKYAHTAYYGNVIPASEAIVKPSITLDGRELTQSDSASLVKESQYRNWSSGLISCENFDDVKGFHTLVMLNLDSIQPNSAYLHWMTTNIELTDSIGTVAYDEPCEYLPVHGIRGLGHSRYVFLLMQHQSRVDVTNLKFRDFSPDSRRFDVNRFLDKNRCIAMTPVGLSWFQTVWDHSSNHVFHDYLKMQAPVYEIVQEKVAKRDLLDKGYPGKVPFNIFMDHYSDPKQINERVLLERLKGVNPFDYKDQYVVPRVPPTVFEEENIPSWMNSVMFKKKNKLGSWRGLRPASATIPLNNNADLDYPIKPVEPPKKRLPGYPNHYPARPKVKLLKDLPYSKPANEHTNVYIQEDHEIHLDKVRAMTKDLEHEKV